MASTTLSPGWNTQYYRWYRFFFAQDDWHVNSKLTLNVGARYDYIQPISSNAGAVANLLISSVGLTSPEAGTGSGSARGTGVYVMSSKFQSENLLPTSFLTLLGTQNVTTDYQSSNSLVSGCR